MRLLTAVSLVLVVSLLALLARAGFANDRPSDLWGGWRGAEVLNRCGYHGPFRPRVWLSPDCIKRIFELNKEFHQKMNAYYQEMAQKRKTIMTEMIQKRNAIILECTQPPGTPPPTTPTTPTTPSASSAS